MKAVCDDDELMLITQKGIMMRTKVSEIRETGRNAAGVKLIRVDEGDLLVAMAKVDAEEAEPTPQSSAAAVAGGTAGATGAPGTDGDGQASAPNAEAPPTTAPDADAPSAEAPDADTPPSPDGEAPEA